MPLTKEEIKQIAKEVRTLHREEESKKEEKKKQILEEKMKKEEMKKLKDEENAYWKHYDKIEHFCEVLQNDEYQLEDHVKFNKDVTERYKQIAKNLLADI